MNGRPEKVIEKLRKFCLNLPEASETTSFGNPTFKAGKKTFAVLDTYAGDSFLCVKVDKAKKKSLLKDQRFAEAPYIGRRGWILFHAERVIPDWNETEELLLNSYKDVALKRMIAAL